MVSNYLEKQKWSQIYMKFTWCINVGVGLKYPLKTFCLNEVQIFKNSNKTNDLYQHSTFTMNNYFNVALHRRV